MLAVVCGADDCSYVDLARLDDKRGLRGHTAAAGGTAAGTSGASVRRVHSPRLTRAARPQRRTTRLRRYFFDDGLALSFVEQDVEERDEESE